VNLHTARLELWLQRRPVLRFLATVLALLPACFLAWYALADTVAAPAALLADGALSAWLPSILEDSYLKGTQFMVVSRLGEVNGAFLAAGEAGNQLAFAIDTRLFSYAVPFFCALFFATPLRDRLSRFAWSLLALWLLMAAGLVATALKDLMLTLGAVFLDAPGVPPDHVIALAYQFATLMLPPLTPVILWAYAAGDSELLRDLLGVSRRPAQDSD